MDLLHIENHLRLTWRTTLGGLTNFAKSYLTSWQQAHVHKERPEWDEYFMTLALIAATRSHDAQSQVGAILVKDKHVIGTGYNAFPSDMPDDNLPNTRPLKYEWIIHAEVNALCNCTVDPQGAICYVNVYPCLECMKILYQKGIKNFVATKGEYAMLRNYTDQQKATYLYLVDRGKINIRELEVSGKALSMASAILEKTKG